MLLTQGMLAQSESGHVTSPYQEAAERELEEMMEAGIIEPLHSSWSSAVVTVPRKKGFKWRFCVDYRQLNKVTKKDSYPLPRVDETLDLVSGSSWFSALDLRSGLCIKDCIMHKQGSSGSLKSLILAFAMPLPLLNGLWTEYCKLFPAVSVWCTWMISYSMGVLLTQPSIL